MDVPSSEMRSASNISLVSVLWSCLSRNFFVFSFLKITSDILIFINPQILRWVLIALVASTVQYPYWYKTRYWIWSELCYSKRCIWDIFSNLFLRLRWNFYRIYRTWSLIENFTERTEVSFTNQIIRVIKVLSLRSCIMNFFFSELEWNTYLWWFFMTRVCTFVPWIASSLQCIPFCTFLYKTRRKNHENCTG